MRLSRCTALVTGSARRLGREIARALAERGARLAVHYGHSREAAREAVDELVAGGIEAKAFQADLTRPDEVDRLFAEIDARWGGLDLLVNSAAGFESSRLEAIDAAAWDEVMALNLRAPFLCLRAALPLMRRGADRRGAAAAVVNLGDLSGLQAWSGYAHHAVSKAGLLHLTRVAARELAPEVRVNALVPGAILPPPGLDPADASWQSRGERVPLGRIGGAAEVGRAVAFLAENDFLTGVVLPVDGGEALVGRRGDDGLE